MASSIDIAAPTRLTLPRVNRRGQVLTHTPACPRCGCIRYQVNVRPSDLFGARLVWASAKPAVSCCVCGHGFEGIRIRADGVIDLLVPIHDARCTR